MKQSDKQGKISRFSVCHAILVLGNIAPDSGIPEEDSFFFGYLTHLLTDKIWAREIVLPAKEKQNELYRSNPELFWDTIKTDWYDLVFMYLKSNPSFEAFQIYRRIKNLKNTYMDIFPENAFEERCRLEKSV